MCSKKERKSSNKCSDGAAQAPFFSFSSKPEKGGYRIPRMTPKILTLSPFRLFKADAAGSVSRDAVRAGLQPSERFYARKLRRPDRYSSNQPSWHFLPPVQGRLSSGSHREKGGWGLQAAGDQCQGPAPRLKNSFTNDMVLNHWFTAALSANGCSPSRSASAQTKSLQGLAFCAQTAPRSSAVTW